MKSHRSNLQVKLDLQDFSKEIKSKACQMQVHKYVELAAQDIRFDVPLADACYNDRMELCANVPPVSHNSPHDG